MSATGQKYFNELKELIAVMRSSEVVLAKKHIAAYETNHTIRHSKMLRLFKLILKNPEITYDKSKKIINKSADVYSFNRLIKRLSSRVRESLILEININRKGAYNDLFKVKYELRKLITQAQLIQSRGLTNNSLNLLNNIIQKATKYELYDELVEALYLKQANIFLKKGKAVYDQLTAKIAFFEKCRLALYEAKDRYRSYFAEAAFTSVKLKKAQKLKALTDRLSESYQETKSANVGNYMYLLQMEYYFLLNHYARAVEVGQVFVELVRDNPSIYSDQRIGYIYFNLAYYKIAAVDMEAAYQYAIKAKSYLTKFENINLLVALEFEATAALHNGRNDISLEAINTMLDLSVIEKYPLSKTKAIYTKSINLFISGEYKTASFLLSNLKEMEKDKEGWNVWIRIMRILCNVEMLKLNFIDYDVESFRKYMQRVSRLKEVRPRDQLVLKVLLSLDRHDFDFEHTYELQQENLALLSGLDSEYIWESKSPELLLFHEWFMSKLEQRPYQPNYERYRLHIEKEEQKEQALEMEKETGEGDTQPQQISLEL